MKKIILIFFVFGVIFASVIGNAKLGSCTFRGGEEPIAPSYGAECWNVAGYPIGGGPGYADTVSTPSNNHTSSYIVTGDGNPADSLVSFLGSAGDGDTVYIAHGVEVDMTNDMMTDINSGVLLAGSRGCLVAGEYSWGALIYVDNFNATGGDAVFRMTSGRDNIKFKGLRFRGSYSELEGNRVATDTITNYGVPSERCLWSQYSEGFEVANCEFWGWGTAAVYCWDSVINGYFHNNHFHHRPIYHGYITTYISSNPNIAIDVHYEANYYSDRADAMDGGGNYSLKLRGEYSYNIFAMHNNGSTIYGHGAASEDARATCNAHHNTMWKNDYGERNVKKVYSGEEVADDTIFIDSNWTWCDDSADAFGGLPAKCRIFDNAYTPTYPEGLAARIPVANIVTNVDSGSAPLLCSLYIDGSSDPDGSLMQYYITWGDSSKSANYVRGTDFNDTLVYTFNQIGKYQIYVEVVDDYGFRDFAYKTINVKPASGNWISFWVKDYCHRGGTRPGDLYAQLIINECGEGGNWVAWEDDLAGYHCWQHVTLDLTDSVSLKDSITVRFRWYAKQTNADYSHLQFMVDEVASYGGALLNGNFDSTVTWTGTSLRTDGIWATEELSQGGQIFYIWESGYGAYGGNLGIRTDAGLNSITAGDYVQIYQKIGVE